MNPENKGPGQFGLLPRNENNEQPKPELPAEEQPNQLEIDLLNEVKKLRRLVYTLRQELRRVRDNARQAAIIVEDEVYATVLRNTDRVTNATQTVLLEDKKHGE